jgi:uncharacterized DUF497 family protein
VWVCKTGKRNATHFCAAKSRNAAFGDGSRIVVSHTDCEARTRINSARGATRKETKAYEEG